MPSPHNWEVRKLLIRGAEALGVHLDPYQVDSFFTYLEELQDWNKKINLTSLRSDQDIIIRHFIDSLTPLNHINPPSVLLDIGSGAGFPGIPLKIAQPSLSVTLIDSVRKKVSFQKHIIRHLNLQNIQVFQQRLGDKTGGLIKDRYFDVVISRAFTRLENYLVIGEPYVRKNGQLIAMAGKLNDRELTCHQELFHRLKLTHVQTVHLALPFSGDKRTLLFFQK